MERSRLAGLARIARILMEEDEELVSVTFELESEGGESKVRVGRCENLDCRRIHCSAIVSRFEEELLEEEEEASL